MQEAPKWGFLQRQANGSIWKSVALQLGTYARVGGYADMFAIRSDDSLGVICLRGRRHCFVERASKC